MRWLKQVYTWVNQRVQLQDAVVEAATHPIPRSTASWWYVFGSASLTLLVLQLLTGVLLALVYVPSAGEAWNSLQVLNHQMTLGWFLRAVHGWGSNFMIAVVLVHMMQVFLFGAYKLPREMTWVVGVFLLLMTLGMAFTGQVLRFDQDAYWGLGIGASITSRVPVVGGPLVHLLLGGPTIAGTTFSHFFALHVFIIPGALLGLVGLHLLMVLKLGVNEWPMPGRLVRRETYLQQYQEAVHKDGVPFIPDAFWKDLMFSAAIVLAVAVCAAWFGPFGPTGRPDPTIIQTVPKPDFFFRWIYSMLALLPAYMETPFILVMPVIGIGALVLVPFVAGEGEKHWSRRPVAVLVLLVMAIGLGTLTHLASYVPWGPHMEAWSGDAVPVQYLDHRTPLERQGALVFQNKQCRDCHQLGGHGGMRGPALDNVASHMTHEELVRQVLQGGGNMPAYGKQLSPAETTALVQFLETLHPAGQPSAEDASRKVARAARSAGQ